MIHFLFQIINFFSCLRLPQSNQTCDQVMIEKCRNRCQIVEITCYWSQWSWVIVRDRTSKISQRACSKLSAICLRSQNADMSYMVVPPIACDRTTICAWSYHQSFVIVCQAVALSVVRPVTSCSDWLHNLSICNRSPQLVVRVSVRLLTIGEEDMYDKWRFCVRSHRVSAIYLQPHRTAPRLTCDLCEWLVMEPTLLRPNIRPCCEFIRSTMVAKLLRLFWQSKTLTKPSRPVANEWECARSLLRQWRPYWDPYWYLTVFDTDGEWPRSLRPNPKILSQRGRNPGVNGV